MSLGLIQEAPYTGSGTTSATTFTMALTPTPGSDIVVTATVSGNPGFKITAASGAGCASWTKVSETLTPNGGFISTWYGLNSDGSTGAIILTRNGYNNSTCAIQANIAEFAGVQISGTVTDGTPAAATGSHTPASSGNTTPTAGTSVLLIGVCARQVNAGKVFTGITAGFTALSTPDNASFAPGYQIVAVTSGSYSFGWTGQASSGTYMNWASMITAFKAAGASALVLPDARRGTHSLSRGRRGNQSLLGR